MNRVLFKRHDSYLAKVGQSHVSLLSIQYRMHPAISEFPSKHFYDSKLQNACVVNGKCFSPPYHNDQCFGPFVFLDIAEGTESRSSSSSGAGSNSLYNTSESSIILLLYKCLTKRYPVQDFTGKIGIITPYKRQRVVINEEFSKSFGNTCFSDIEVNTIDGFQGREKDIIFLSTVRSRNSGLGFVSDVKRMNVALTRARYSMIIVGNSKSLESNPTWKALLDHAKEKNAIVPCSTNLLKEFLRSQDSFSKFVKKKSSGNSSGTSFRTRTTPQLGHRNDVNPCPKSQERAGEESCKSRESVSHPKARKPTEKNERATPFTSKRREMYKVSDESSHVIAEDRHSVGKGIDFPAGSKVSKGTERGAKEAYGVLKEKQANSWPSANVTPAVPLTGHTRKGIFFCHV